MDYDNKNILFMGDSITALGTDKRGWIRYFNEIIKPAHFVNVAVPGATIEDKEGTVYDGEPVFIQSDSEQLNNVLGNQLEKILRGKDSSHPNYHKVEDYQCFDYIFIAAGTNCGHRIGLTETVEMVDRQFIDNKGNALPLDKVNRKTWSGAIRYIYENLRRMYPCAKIFFCSPVQAADSVERAYASIKAKGEIIKAVCDRISDVCFVDTFNCGICGIYEQRGKNGRDLIDGLHPNENGARKIGEYNARALKWFTL